MRTKLCHVCLADYKDSKIGKQQRKLHVNKKPAAYGKDNWPLHLYHNCDSRLCEFHQKQYMIKVNKSYRERDLLLKSMGFISYQEYLESSLWDMIRTDKLAKAGAFVSFAVNLQPKYTIVLMQLKF